MKPSKKATKTWRSLIDSAHHAYLKGEYGEAVRSYILAKETAEKAWGPSHPAVGETLRRLGDVYLQEGNLLGAESTFMAAVKAYDSAEVRDSRAVADCLMRTADALRLMGREQAANEYQGQARKLLLMIERAKPATAGGEKSG
ncbi:MAG TPA: tetratricopeptide repeat protein [Candidatus Obscuribacterales bacterium]